MPKRRPIQWARQTVEGRQIEADGSKLVNFYAVILPSPQESKTAVMLYGTSGRRKFVRIPVKTGVDTQKGVHALLQVDSAIYGQWLFGISSQSQFFRIKLDGDDKSISSSYDPFNVDNPQIWAVPQEQILTYTGESDVILDTDEPGKLVSDGRYIVWAAKDGAVYYDLKFPNRGVQLLSTPVPSDPTDLDDIPKDWVDCDWIDGYFILASRNGQFFHSLLY